MPPLLQKVLQTFDEEPFKPISESSDVYQALIKDIKEDIVYEEDDIDELIAFGFVELTRDLEISGEYFLAPQLEPKAVISLSQITVTKLVYWRERAASVKHPTLKARYLGLVWEFSSAAEGKKDYSIVQPYVEALLSIVKEKLYVTPVHAIGKLTRAMFIAIEANNKLLQERIKQVVLAYEKGFAVDYEKNHWGVAYDLLIGLNKKLVTVEEEESIIGLLESRVQHLKNKDPWACEAAVNRLCDYYRRQNKRDLILSNLHSLEESFNFAHSNKPEYMKTGYVEKLLLLYRNFTYTKEEERLLIRLREINKASLTGTENDDNSSSSFFKKISTSINLP